MSSSEVPQRGERRNTMAKMKKALAAGLLVGLFATAALAAGLYTNGMPTVAPGTANGVVATFPSGVVTQLPPGAGNAIENPSSVEAPNPLIPVDVNRSSGGVPQTVAATPFQIWASLAESTQNTTTSTVHNAVLATLGGLVTTESLSTAAGSTYTFTLTNSLITAASPPPQVAMYSKSNVAGGPMSVTSVTNGSGVSTWVFTNTGSAALSGTMMIIWHL
jgi:hypothetical protein